MSVGDFLDVVLKVLGGATALGAIALTTLQLLGVKWFDKLLDRRLESHKAELARHSEQLKHDLQREMLKAELATGKMHEVYAQLWELIVRAHGTVAGLVGGRFAPSYDNYDAEDFAKLLADTHLPHGEQARLLQAIERNRKTGQQEVERVFRRVEIDEARRQVFEAKNYAALKSPFLSPAVRERTAAFTKAIWSAWVDIHVGSMPGNPNSQNPLPALNEADEKLTELEVQISKELHPGGQHPGIASAVTAIGTAEAPKLPPGKGGT